MKTITSRLAALLLLFMGVVAANAETKVWLDDITLAPGEEAVVGVNLDNAEDNNIIGVILNVTLPEGLEIIPNEEGDLFAKTERLGKYHAVSSTYRADLGCYRLNINLNGRLQSKRLFPDEDDAPGYGIWNINTRHTFDHIKHVQIEPSIGIDNIFNKKDCRPKGVNYALLSPGRMLTVGLNIKFY